MGKKSLICIIAAALSLALGITSWFYSTKEINDYQEVMDYAESQMSTYDLGDIVAKHLAGKDDPIYDSYLNSYNEFEKLQKRWEIVRYAATGTFVVCFVVFGLLSIKLKD